MFNIFSGFPLEKIKLTKDIDFTKSLLYKHIRDEFCCENDGKFNHFLDHIADIIQCPAEIRGPSHLFYTKQGMLKGGMAKWMSKLLGSDHVISFGNTDDYFSNFNADQSNKLLKIFEEVSDKGTAFKKS